MQIGDVLRQAQSGDVVPNLARAFDVAPEEVDAAIRSMLPEMTRRLERNTLSRGGIADLVAALGQTQSEAVLDDPALAASPQTRTLGNGVLEANFGSRNWSRGVAARAAAASGLDDEVVKRLLPVVAAMLIGGLARESRGAIDEAMKTIPGLSRRGNPLPVAGSGSFADTVPLQSPRSGSIPSQSPLPVPGDRIPDFNPSGSPYDDLSDIIRRGGRVPGAPGGGSLAKTVRDIIGSILGFRSRGLLGWIVRLILLRWVWGLVRRILGRALLGR